MISLLAQAGLGFVADLMRDNGEELVKEGIKKVTGIELKDKPSPEEIAAIKEQQQKITEQVYKDRADARKMNVDLQASSDWLVRNTGSLLAIFVILSAFTLDVFILYQAIDLGVNSLNPIVTLIAGATSTKAVQVLSFYFGDSKVNADTNRFKKPNGVM